MWPISTARIQDPHMGPISTYVHMRACVRTYVRTYVHTYVHTYACKDRHMNVHAQADRQIDIHVHV